MNLPPPLAEYFAAANSGDAANVAACFTENAVVHDEGRDIRGRDAIRIWAEEAQRKYRYHVEATAVEESAERTIVSTQLTGDFPGGQVDLRYRFKLAGTEIAALEIG